MTRTQTAGNSLLDQRRKYRRLMYGFVLGGVAVALLLREVLGYPLLSEAVYWIGILGFLAVWQGTSLTLFDERDRSLERRASHLTLQLFAVVLVLAASAARVIPRVTAYEVPSAVWPALYGFVALYVTFGAVYLALRYRP
ncbi:DUF2178 domain-containing protein [Halorussus lipolyticus]|uniref:DUF2178 domain-containing protein n=1 Tax=Halorussus lipolyticus TaxID=3034024 RepID=UPI0023E8D3E6|nr:DUF2178 domain-containing protein [Halorussus sp. DT80]